MKVKKTYKLRAASYYCNHKRYVQGDIFSTEENSSIKSFVQLGMLKEITQPTEKEKAKEKETDAKATERGSKLNVPKTKFINEDLKEKKSKKSNKDVNLDLNGDGKVDSADASIGAKVMAHVKNNKTD